MVERIDPGFTVAERPMLEQWLEFHRATLLLKCEGLAPEQLAARSAPPSTLSLLGLVRHMAEVERNWFHRVLEGDDAPPRYYSDDDPDGDILFGDVAGVDVDACFAAFAEECQSSRAIAARHGLDDTGMRRGGAVSLRWIYVHMIVEYASPNGQAVILSEAIVGVTGEWT